MKKFFIILLFIILVSCNKSIIRVTYHGSYIDKEVATTDIYDKLNQYEMPYIPLSDWINTTWAGDDVLIIGNTVRKIVSKKSEYAFTLYEFCHEQDTIYKFLIRYSGKEKELKNY